MSRNDALMHYFSSSHLATGMYKRKNKRTQYCTRHTIL